MLNIRGNLYSRNHQFLNPGSEDFWSFTFDESARLDYPTAIDYILELTQQEDLSFVGYSMGATQYLILLSELPQYNKKLKMGYLLGTPAITEQCNTFMWFQMSILKQLFGRFMAE